MKIHQEVIGALREVAKYFYDISPASPAYAQLTYTIAAAERLIIDEDGK
jgi:hypothetical protein